LSPSEPESAPKRKLSPSAVGIKISKISIGHQYFANKKLKKKCTCNVSII
jgi:hypothetical protein